VPAAASEQRNPLKTDPADITAGHDLFQKNCEICHGYDGKGKTQIGGEEFPRAPVLTSLLTSMSDGEVFYHVRNGIRNTGMPAWGFPDRELWQLVLYMRNLPKTAPLSVGLAANQASGADPHYVGSETCKTCHADIYERWKKTPMANVVRDPREHPDAFIPDFSNLTRC
jgi:cytochrome c5